ncbi:MAG: hypothetical protein WD397_08060, partial [Wenzhouxiangellaceae bacterium]
GICLLAGAANAAPTEDMPADSPTVVHEIVESGGLKLEMRLSPAARGRDALRAEETVELELRFSYADTGKPLIGAYPAAWLDHAAADDSATEVDEQSCRQTIGRHLGGDLMSAAEVDFNQYLVLTIDDEDSISVIDPRFGFGGSRLLDRVPLDAPASDWVLDQDGNWLFVSMPEQNAVAAIETASWTIQTRFRVGANPRRLGIQPDGARLWIGHDGSAGENPGVTVIDARGFRTLQHIATGNGPHDFAFSDDSRHLFVVNRADNTVSLISTARLEVTGTLDTGRTPTSVAWSEHDGTAWVAHADGTLAVIDPERREIVTSLDLAAGSAAPALGRVVFAPGDRFAFVPIPGGEQVHVIDTARRTVIRSVKVGNKPVEIGFSDQFAYVTHLDSPMVHGISLDGLNDADGETKAVEIPIGRGPAASHQRPFGTVAMMPAPDAPAMLFAHAEDRAVYYYMEGMAAPMGSFTTSRVQARALLVLDRSLRERAPGTYLGRARLGRDGPQQLSVFINSPRWSGCIPVAVDPNPEIEAKRLARRPLTVELLPGIRRTHAGEPLTVEVRLRETIGQAPVDDADDATALAVLAPGVAQRRYPLQHHDDGVYSLEFTPDEAGTWYLSFASASKGLGFSKSPYLMIEVLPAASTATR